MTTYVDYAIRDGAARITFLDGDGGNSIQPESVSQLRAAVERARRDGVGVIVLASTGRFFSVGGDLTAFNAAEDVSAFIEDLADELHRAVVELMRADAVVVSVVQGIAAGAGFPLAAAADLVLAGRSAKFTLGYTKVGLSIDGGSSLLAHSLGLHRALRLALLNDVLSADEAFSAGLVARVFDDEALAEESEKVVAQLVSGAAAAQGAAKRLIREVVEPAPERAMDAEVRAIRDRAASVDGREGVAAFLAKRPASFTRAGLSGE